MGLTTTTHSLVETMVEQEKVDSLMVAKHILLNIHTGHLHHTGSSSSVRNRAYRSRTYIVQQRTLTKQSASKPLASCTSKQTSPQESGCLPESGCWVVAACLYFVGLVFAATLVRITCLLVCVLHIFRFQSPSCWARDFSCQSPSCWARDFSCQYLYVKVVGCW